MSRKRIRNAIKRGDKTLVMCNDDGTITVTKRVQKRTLRKAVAQIGIEKLIENGWNITSLQRHLI